MKFSAPPTGKTMWQTPKRFQSARKCSRSSITMPSLILCTLLGEPKMLVFVCLCVVVLNSKVSENFMQKALELTSRSDFNIVG